MSEQLVISLIAASVGFVAAIFLCIGSALTSAKNIKFLCGTYWNFNIRMAHSLAAQRGQYVTGALLLLVSFGLQLLAALASATIPAVLPRWIDTWHFLVLSVTAVTALVGLALCVLIYRATIEKALRLLAQPPQ